MAIESYINWVRDANLEAAKVNKCLSCFALNSGTLNEYYKDGITPVFAVIKLTLEKREKAKCICKEKNLKR